MVTSETNQPLSPPVPEIEPSNDGSLLSSDPPAESILDVSPHDEIAQKSKSLPPSTRGRLHDKPEQ